MTVSDKDVAPITPTENPRAQALSPGIINAGDEFWLETKFMLPQNLPSVPGWMSLVSIYGAPFDGSSPWQIGVDDNEFRWQRNGTYNWDIPWRAPLVKGSWVTVLLHERFATDGWVEMWIDGQQVSFFPSGGDNRPHRNRAPGDEDDGLEQRRRPQRGEDHAVPRSGDVQPGPSTSAPLKVGTSRASVGG